MINCYARKRKVKIKSIKKQTIEVMNKSQFIQTMGDARVGHVTIKS